MVALGGAFLLRVLLVAAAGDPGAGTPAASNAALWPGEEMPLPLAVKTGRDLMFKQEAERQYLIFNLYAGGKLAFDRGDFARAARSWETLLRVPNLPGEVDKQVRQWLPEAVARRGETPPAGSARPSSLAPERSPAVERAPLPAVSTVSGVVTGGGPIGPAAAVLWLKRLDQPTPPARPASPKVISQHQKSFVPRVLAVPVGTRVDFRNDDDFYHNVFSLSQPGKFDTGLYAAGLSHSQVFDKPGPIELLCNIHASMLGYLYVVDSPYYAQPRAGGTFTIRGVPPGQYELWAWHESSLQPVRQVVWVAHEPVRGITVRIPSDREPLTQVPDKYGKPRAAQLGY